MVFGLLGLGRPRPESLPPVSPPAIACSKDRGFVGKVLAESRAYFDCSLDSFELVDDRDKWSVHFRPLGMVRLEAEVPLRADTLFSLLTSMPGHYIIDPFPKEIHSQFVKVSIFRAREYVTADCVASRERLFVCKSCLVRDGPLAETKRGKVRGNLLYAMRMADLEGRPGCRLQMINWIDLGRNTVPPKLLNAITTRWYFQALRRRLERMGSAVADSLPGFLADSLKAARRVSPEHRPPEVSGFVESFELYEQAFAALAAAAAMGNGAAISRQGSLAALMCVRADTLCAGAPLGRSDDHGSASLELTEKLKAAIKAHVISAGGPAALADVSWASGVPWLLGDSEPPSLSAALLAVAGMPPPPVPQVQLAAALLSLLADAGVRQHLEPQLAQLQGDLPSTLLTYDQLLGRVAEHAVHCAVYASADPLTAATSKRVLCTAAELLPRLAAAGQPTVAACKLHFATMMASTLSNADRQAAWNCQLSALEHAQAAGSDYFTALGGLTLAKQAIEMASRAVYPPTPPSQVLAALQAAAAEWQRCKPLLPSVWTRNIKDMRTRYLPLGLEHFFQGLVEDGDRWGTSSAPFVQLCSEMQTQAIAGNLRLLNDPNASLRCGGCGQTALTLKWCVACRKARYCRGSSCSSVPHRFKTLKPNTPLHCPLLAFLLVPDVEPVAPLNALVQQLWPHVEQAASKLATRGGFLERLINETTFWRPPMLAGSTVKVHGVVLGQQPPSITGVKVYGQQEGVAHADRALTLDCSFIWASKLDVQLGVQFAGTRASLWALLSTASTIKIGVRDLVSRGALRIELRPLIDDMPLAGAIKLSFISPPSFSYALRVLGGNPLGTIPLLESWAESFIQSVVLQPLTWPDGLAFDLIRLTPFTLLPKPEGVLTIEVVEAVNVPRMDWFSKSDPYVVLQLSERMRFRTAYKPNTSAPAWGETFKAIVYDSRTQVLTVTLWDNDVGADDLIGRVELPLRSLDLGCPKNDVWVEVPRASRTQHIAATAVPVGPNGSSVATGMDPGSGGALRRGDTAQELAHTTASMVQRCNVLPSPRSSPTAAVRDASRLERPSGRSEQLREMVAAALQPRECQLHLRLSYVRFSKQEVEAGPNTPYGSRMRRALEGGVLQVYIERAESLVTSSVEGSWTKRLVVKVSVAGQRKRLEHALGLLTTSPLKQKRSPIFDAVVEFVVDGDMARRPGEVVSIEIWRYPILPRPLQHPHFKGCLSIPLADVVRTRQLRGPRPLEGVPSGRLHFNLEWMSATGM
eukprot:scaffold8.g1553.t1